MNVSVFAKLIILASALILACGCSTAPKPVDQVVMVLDADSSAEQSLDGKHVRVTLRSGEVLSGRVQEESTTTLSVGVLPNEMEQPRAIDRAEIDVVEVIELADDDSQSSMEMLGIVGVGVLGTAVVAGFISLIANPWNH